MFRFINSCTTQALRKRLVELLVVPYLDYCAVVYFDASSTIRTRLQQIANADVRYIFGIRRDTQITPYRQQLGWLRNDSRLDYFVLLLLYGIVRMKEPPPPFLLPLFQPFQSDGMTHSRSKDFDTKKVLSDTFQGRYAHLQNSIP